MKKIIACLIIIFSSISAFITAENLDRTKMLSELETIKNIFDFQYAPKIWKKDYFGWDLEEEIEKSKQLILSKENITLKDFQIIVRNFFRSTRDYHVKVIFISTETAFLPIDIKGTNGKYFIVHVDKTLLSPKQYPINVGDEITQFNGRPIDEVISELQLEEFGTKGKGTDKSLTEYMLTHRAGVMGNEVPRGPVSIQIRHLGSIAPSNYQLIWSYTPEKITNGSSKLAAFDSVNASKKKKNEKIKYFNKPWMTPYYEPFGNSLLDQILNDVDAEEEEESEKTSSPFALGSKNSFVPPLGRIWWENDKKYWKAYIFETPNSKLVGYLRIPHYNDLLGSSIEELKNIIKLFEERTDALVIDQVNNPGGLVFYMYAIASLLTDQALQTPKHRMAITHEDVYKACDNLPGLESIDSDQAAEQQFGNHLCGYPVSYQFAQHWLEFCRFITEQWNCNKRFTDPFHIYGVDHINPNAQIRYTKPILFLINEMDFSCADFLPAIFQDNKRATIMGTQTSGAGGYVLTNQLKSRFGIAGFRITGSIASRADTQPIENLGVTPDIVYELSEFDYQYNFLNYKLAILDAINKLLGL